MEYNQENEPCDFPEIMDFTGMKKKKKKIQFGFDEIAPQKQSGTDTPLSAKDCNEMLNLDDLNFDLLKKKKKKKISAPDFSNSDSKTEICKPETDMPLVTKDSSEILDMDEDLSFNSLKKKKKRKVNIHDNDAKVEAKNLDCTLNELKEDADCDYSYDDLLSRIYGIMRKKDPTIDLGGRKKLVMKPPQVIRIGTKKSSFVNFIDICKMLHRTPQHLQSFLLVELGTSGSVDGNNQLIIKGRFEQKQIESVLRSYIKEYVTCHTCHSPDTFLQKDIRLFFLQCESCGSRCSVASIKSGFQAVTSKRAAMRAKAN